MNRRLLPVLAVTVAAVVSACSLAAAPPAGQPELDGHTYLSTAIRGAALVPGTQVQLAFSKGSLGASGGCNLMSGPYSIDGDRLATNQLSMTEMACDDARQRQDDWLARFLGAVTVTLDGGTLTVTDGTVTLTLLDSEVAPDAGTTPSP